MVGVKVLSYGTGETDDGMMRSRAELPWKKPCCVEIYEKGSVDPANNNPERGRVERTVERFEIREIGVVAGGKRYLNN